MVFFESKIYWQTNPKYAEIFDQLEYLLPKNKSWHQDLTIYGDEESTCLKVFNEDGFVVSATLRIDFATQYETILNSIIEFVMLRGLLLLNEELEVMTFNNVELISIIESSPQYFRYKSLSGPDN